MSYKCEVCHDSGSKNQTGDYLDCPACDMPHTRKALNDFVKSLGPTHPEDVALAIHQRALAMAVTPAANAGEDEGWQHMPPISPGVFLHRHKIYKGEDRLVFVGWVSANEPLNQGYKRPQYAMCMRVCPADEPLHADRLTPEAWGGMWKPIASKALRPALAMAPKQEVAAQKPIGMVAKSSFASHKVLVATSQLDDVPLGAKLYLSAPAAANGALTDEQILEIRDTSSHVDMEKLGRMLTPGETLIEFARAILAAAGPDAALVKALEQIASIEDKMVGGDWEEIDEARTIARAALSGAKGN